MGTARHSETEEPFVVYHRDGSPDQLWVRPEGMWAERVQRDGHDGPRFSAIED